MPESIEERLDNLIKKKQEAERNVIREEQRLEGIKQELTELEEKAKTLGYDLTNMNQDQLIILKGEIEEQINILLKETEDAISGTNEELASA